MKSKPARNAACRPLSQTSIADSGATTQNPQMPSYVPRSLEPYQKQELLEKRISELRNAIHSGATPTKLAKAAEKVRQAVFTLIKAKRSIIAEQQVALTGGRKTSNADTLTRQLANLQKQSDQWSSMSVEEILVNYNSLD